MKGTRIDRRTGKFARELFDPTKTFVAARNIILHGKLIKIGEVFPKQKVNHRRLRQMYEQRLLNYSEEVVAPEQTTYEPIKPDFDTLSDEGLRVWLRNNGYIARPKTPREKLLELAQQKWKEYMDGLAVAAGTRKANSEGVQRETAERNASSGNSEHGKRIRRSRNRSSANV